MSSHYSVSMKVREGLKAVERAASNVVSTLGEGLYDDLALFLAYRGMSGVSSATRLADELYRTHQIEVGMIYVRKPGEDSHGKPVEVCGRATDWRPWSNRLQVLFVDDFICSGGTKDAVLTAVLKELAPGRYLAGDWRSVHFGVVEVNYNTVRMLEKIA